MQRAPVFAPRERYVGLVGSGARMFSLQHHDSVEGRVELVDAGQVQLKQFARADAAGFDAAHKLNGTAKRHG